METLWGIILLVVMYIVIPVAIMGGTLALLGFGNLGRRGRGRRSQTFADDRSDQSRPVGSGR